MIMSPIVLADRMSFPESFKRPSPSRRTSSFPKTKLECVPEESPIVIPKPKSHTTKHKKTKPESELAPPTLCFKSSYPRRDVSSYQTLLNKSSPTSNYHQRQKPSTRGSPQEHESDVDIGELIEADIDDDEMIVFATFLNTLDTRDMVLRANSLINHSRKHGGKHPCSNSE